MITLTSPSRWLVTRAVASAAAAPVRWVYFGESVRTMEATAGHLGLRAQRIMLTDLLQETARSLRSGYIEYIGKLGVEQDSTAWWFSSLAEKNPAVSKAFLHICYLAAAADLCRRRENGGHLLLVVEDRDVLSAISTYLRESGTPGTEVRESVLSRAGATVRDWAEMLVRRVRGVARHTARMVTARWFLGFSAGLANGAIAGDSRRRVLLCNWIDDRSFDPSRRYRDVLFGNLREELEKRGVPVVVVTLIRYRPAVRSYGRILAMLKRSGIPMLVPEAALTLPALFRWIGSLPLRPPQKRAWPRFEGFDISDILTEAERVDWIDTRAADVRLLSGIVRQWSGRFKAQVFIYSYEGQSWERGFCKALREFFPQARLIGYQNSTVPPMWLSYFISSAEWEKGPVPDRVVTNGRYNYDLLKRNGLPERVLACGGAIRYHMLGRESRASRPESDRSVIRVLVTPSIMETQAAELLLAALRAFADPGAFRVTFKFHPYYPPKRVLKAAGVGSLPAHMAEVVDTPVSELLREADVLVYTDTTAAVEVLAYGVPIVHLRSGHAIDMDRLGNFDRGRVSVGTTEELRSAVRAVVMVGAGEHAARVRRWHEIVDMLLPPPDEKTIDLFMPENVR